MSIKTVTDFALDSDGDMYADSSGLAMTGDLDGIRQQIMLRLGFFKGEWFLDEENGIPWYEEILVKNPSVAKIQTIFRDAILSVKGVRDVLSLSVVFSARREITITFTASTDLGELSDTLGGLPRA